MINIHISRFRTYLNSNLIAIKAHMLNINIFKSISIKSKTYLLILLSVFIALILMFLSNSGLDVIRIEQKKLNSASNIVRYTNNLINEEQEYRLNTNGSIYNLAIANHSYQNALTYIKKIHNELDQNDSSPEEKILIEKTRAATNEYKKLYLKAVSILTNLNQQAETLEAEGELITLNIQEYVESKRVEIKKKLSQKTIEKINAGSNVWQFTYVTRLHEKKYRLSPDSKVLQSFTKDYQFMSSEWQRLKTLSEQTFELKKLKDFNISSQKYNAAMMLWVELNKTLVSNVLPKMRTLGNNVISSAIQSANFSVQHMANKRSNMSLAITIIGLLTIILAILIGALIARSISSPLNKLKEHALAISNGNYESKIDISSKDEIGQLSEAFNHMSTTIAAEMLSREKAEEAQRRFQKMNAIGKLTGGIAHDFNNLLAIILGNTELLATYESINPEARNNINTIEKAGLRAASLTRQLLNFARTNPNQLAIVNVNQSINDMTEIITRSLTPEIKVKYTLYHDLYLTQIDAGDFSDTLLNICINARDSITGHGSLTIATHNITIDQAFCAQNPGIKPGEYIHIGISDTGEGIPEEIKERIFEPFFTTKDQGKGTGLGLAMVYGFVNRSNGYIKCESKIGIGTTFHIYLPKKEQEAV